LTPEPEALGILPAHFVKPAPVATFRNGEGVEALTSKRLPILVREPSNDQQLFPDSSVAH